MKSCLIRLIFFLRLLWMLSIPFRSLNLKNSLIQFQMSRILGIPSIVLRCRNHLKVEAAANVSDSAVGQMASLVAVSSGGVLRTNGSSISNQERCSKDAAFSHFRSAETLLVGVSSVAMPFEKTLKRRKGIKLRNRPHEVEPDWLPPSHTTPFEQWQGFLMRRTSSNLIGCIDHIIRKTILKERLRGFMVGRTNSNLIGCVHRLGRRSASLIGSTQFPGSGPRGFRSPIALRWSNKKLSSS